MRQGSPLRTVQTYQRASHTTGGGTDSKLPTTATSWVFSISMNRDATNSQGQLVPGFHHPGSDSILVV